MGLIRFRLTVATFLDRWEPRVRRLGEKWGWPQAWLQEFQDYLNEPRMTQEEFWVRYTLKRMDAQPLLKNTMTEAEARAFYTGHEYMLWRNLVHRRHSTWRRVLVTLCGQRGALLEMGAGIAPVSAWVARRKPRWVYGLIDLESPHQAYGLWRIKHSADAWWSSKVPDAARTFDVVTALDVFEHLAKPEHIAYECVRVLKSGGYLHWNFVGNPRRNDLDLATPEQRDETVAYLYNNLRLVWEEYGYRVSQKR